jgi:hypothetical protein
MPEFTARLATEGTESTEIRKAVKIDWFCPS